MWLRVVGSSLLFVACSGGESHPRSTIATVAPDDVVLAPASASTAAPSAAAPTVSATAAPFDPLALRPVTLVSLATKGEPPPGLPAAPYAALFEVGRRWKISGTLKHGGTSDDGKPVQTSRKFTAACEIAEVERYVWGLRARTACKDLPQIAAEDLVLGHWFALPDGLYHLRELPPSGAVELPPTQRVFPTPIAASLREERDAEMEGALSRWRTFEQRGAWCYEQVTAAGDEAWHEVCISAQAGLVSGSYGWAGGSSDEVEFTAR
jgi:hypothetical protein